MQSKYISAGAISVGSFAIGQFLRFACNIALAKMLAPSSFGLMAVVNMVMLGLSLLSDLGLRLVVIQHKHEPSPLFLNTVWVIQILRAVGMWFFATFAGLLLLALQAGSYISGNVYSDPLLPYMVIVGALGVLAAGFESTNTSMATRSLAISRIATVGLVVQILTLVAILFFAYLSRSPWGLVWGGLVGSLVQCMASYFCYGHFRNSWQFDKKIALDIIKRARWFLVSSPLTFLELNGAVMLLGAMLSPTELGHFMIAFSIVGVVRLVSQQLTGSIMFPALSACVRDTPEQLSRLVRKFQLATDAILVLAAGGFFISGPVIVNLLFDHRYADAGQLVSILGLGLIGTRQCVTEQLIMANGWFKVNPIIILSRLVVLFLGCIGGYYWAGLLGAAWGISISWFAAWPLLLWQRSRIVGWYWQSDMWAMLLFSMGCGLGWIFIGTVRYFHG